MNKETKTHRSILDSFSRSGQSILEVIIAIAIGVILVGGAAALIAPALKSNTQATNVQAGTTLANGLINNVKIFSEANWNNILSLATGSTNLYFLQTAKSPFSVATGTEAISNDNIISGLVGWWKFDEGLGSSTIDSSGNSNIGSWNGIPNGSGGTYYAAGKIGQYAGLFNGANNFVSIANTSTLNVEHAFTLCSWVKFTSAAAEIIVMEKGQWQGSWLLHLKTGGAIGKTPGYLYNALGSSAWGYVAGNTSLATSTWYNLCDTWNGSLATIYTNGILDASSTEVALSVNANPLTIGARGNNTFDFPGSIDDARVYNRALSASEISQIYRDEYLRYFYLSDVSRSGAYDPSTKQVTVGYSWPGSTSNTISTILTRNANFALDQTDWSGGGGQNGPMTTTNSKFSTSSNIDYSTTTGSLYVAIPGY